MKKIMMFLVVGVMLLCTGVAFGQNGSISIDTVDGLYLDIQSALDTNVQVVFWINYTNDVGRNLKGFANGFVVYSPNGAEWTTTVLDTNGAFGKAQFDFGIWFNDFSVDGAGADTVGISGTQMFAGGLPDGWSDTAFSITIGPILSAHEGKTICVDSAFYPPTGIWKWECAPAVNPDWGGPYCYGIIDPYMGVRLSGEGNLPATYTLGQNYPNPFNPTTQIAFDVPTKSHVTLTVYNVLGQQVTTLVNEKLSAGSYEADWDGRSSGGNEVASGIYFYRLHTESFTQTKKMVLLK